MTQDHLDAALLIALGGLAGYGIFNVIVNPTRAIACFLGALLVMHMLKIRLDGDAKK